MLDTYGTIKVLRLTQARRFDAADNLLYHISARSIGLCEPQQPHSAVDRASFVSSRFEMTKQCPVCQNEFRVKPSHSDRRLCCSRACYAEHMKTSLRGANNPNYRARSKTCEVCGKEYTGYSERRKHCSIECYRGKPRRVKRYVQSNFLDQCGFRWCKCIKCGKRFQYHTSSKKYCFKCSPKGMYYRRCPNCKSDFATRYNKKKFCTRKCYNVAIAERQRGERSHLWKGGLTRPEVILRNSIEYGDWRTAVFQRDDYTCQLCFERGGKLAAHHIREYAKHPNLRLQVNNGITLCWPCHQSVKSKERLYETMFYDITGGIRQG